MGKRAFNPKSLLRQLSLKHDEYAEATQQDSHECLRHLIDGVMMEEQDVSVARDKRRLLCPLSKASPPILTDDIDCSSSRRFSNRHRTTILIVRPCRRGTPPRDLSATLRTTLNRQRPRRLWDHRTAGKAGSSRPCPKLPVRRRQKTRAETSLTLRRPGPRLLRRRAAKTTRLPTRRSTSGD